MTTSASQSLPDADLSGDGATESLPPAVLLLYSADPALRGEVRRAVGAAIVQGLWEREVEWVEVVTPGGAQLEIETGRVDLAILDAEAPKLGGVGLARQWGHELESPPPVLLLVAREQDSWLATWSGAGATLLWPADPFALRETVTTLLASDGEGLSAREGQPRDGAGSEQDSTAPTLQASDGEGLSAREGQARDGAGSEPDSTASTLLASDE